MRLRWRLELKVVPYENLAGGPVGATGRSPLRGYFPEKVPAGVWPAARFMLKLQYA